jgi:DNA ligase-1
MSKIYELIEAIAATSKRTEKEALLQATVGTNFEELVKQVFVAAYDGTINYWVKEFPMPEVFNDNYTLQASLKLLGRLSARDITGNDAIEYATHLASQLSEKDAIIFDRIVKRDLRCGATDSTANKVWPGLIEEFPYQRCSSFNAKNLAKIKFPCFSQTKADGLYVDIIVRTNSVCYQTRTGQKLLINDPVRDNILMTGKEYVLQGEALILDPTTPTGYMSRKEGNGILNSDDIDLSKVAFVLWDCLSYEAWKGKKPSLTYEDRLKSLDCVLSYLDDENLKIVDTVVVNSVQEVIDHFKKNVAAGEEGSVVKNFLAIWKDGTSPDQVKVKIEFVCELRVVGFKEGKGRNKGRLGAFLCESAEGLVEVSVGGGYKDAERIRMWNERESYLGKIFAVKSNDLIQNRDTPEKWSLFLPRFTEERKDKTTADSYERILEQRDAFVNTLYAIGKL